MEFLPQISLDFLGILFIIFCSMVFLQLVYLFVFHLRLLLHKKKESTDKFEPVSVIICARNEENNLRRNLPAILTQNYPQFEVIIVDDQSADGTKALLNEFKEKYPFLRSIEIKRNKHSKFGKKVPLTLGIKGAKYDRLAVIDADCKPASNQWLKHMLSNYTESKEIVIGYSPYIKLKGLVNRIIRFDTTQIAVTYLSFAKAGRPYMGVGRNMSYLTDTFFKVDGFKRHYHIQSGDDDLFMQDTATRKNVAIEIHPDSFVYSRPKKTWLTWFQQKQRHFTTASQYRLINKLFLGIFPTTMFLMLVSFFILLFNYKWWAFVLAVFGLRLLLYWIIDGLLYKKLQMGDLVYFFPLLELLHFCLMPFVYYSAKGNQRKKW